MTNFIDIHMMRFADWVCKQPGSFSLALFGFLVAVLVSLIYYPLVIVKRLFEFIAKVI